MGIAYSVSSVNWGIVFDLVFNNPFARGCAGLVNLKADVILVEGPAEGFAVRFFISFPSLECTWVLLDLTTNLLEVLSLVLLSLKELGPRLSFSFGGFGLGPGVGIAGASVFFGGDSITILTLPALALARSASDSVQVLNSTPSSFQRLMFARAATSSQAPFTIKSQQFSKSFPGGGES
jgi:hypothetical protein